MFSEVQNHICVPSYTVPGQSRASVENAFQKFADEVAITRSVFSQGKCGNSTSRYIQETVSFSFLIQRCKEVSNSNYGWLKWILTSLTTVQNPPFATGVIRL